MKLIDKDVIKQAKEAARQLNVHPTNIINCCNGKQKTCKGLHFKYIEKGLALEAPKNMYEKEESK